MTAPASYDSAQERSFEKCHCQIPLASPRVVPIAIRKANNFVFSCPLCLMLAKSPMDESGQVEQQLNRTTSRISFRAATLRELAKDHFSKSLPFHFDYHSYIPVYSAQ